MSAEAEPAINIADLTKSYGDLTALQIEHLVVPTGQLLGLIGPNGAGKSTLIRVLCGLAHPTSARTLRVLGHDPRRARADFKQRIGLVLDSSQLYGQLTADENLQFNARLFGVKLSAAARANALTTVALADRARTIVADYSTGMRQRLNIARAMSVGADLLLLDEPTSGLDPDAAQGIYGVLADLRARGLTIVVSSHNMNEVDTLCDRALFMHEGRVVADGAPAQLKSALFDRITYLDVPESELNEAQQALTDAGIDRWVKRKTQTGWGLLIFEDIDAAVIDAFGYPYSRRPVDLDDVFLHVVNRARV